MMIVPVFHQPAIPTAVVKGVSVGLGFDRVMQEELFNVWISQYDRQIIYIYIYIYTYIYNIYIYKMYII